MPPPRNRGIHDAASPMSVPATPLSLLPDHHHHQEAAAAAAQQNQHQPPQLPQFIEMYDDDDGDEDALLAGPLGGGETVIRGTDVHVPTAAAAFTAFLRTFR